MNTLVLPAEAPGALERALEVLGGGGLIAFPTDTVYGLGARVDDAEAIARLFSAKGRSEQKAIPVLLGDAGDLERVARDLPEAARVLAARFWPGPLTLVVPRRPELPGVLGPDPSIGVRVPDHPVACRLLRAAGPLAVTSANRAGGPNARTAAEVTAQLGGRIELVLDGGEAPGGRPSTVVDLAGGGLHILRAGPLTLESLRAALGAGQGGS